MAAQNKIANKNFEGTKHYSGNGGPGAFDNLKAHTEFQLEGQYVAGPEPKLSKEGGSTPGRGSSEQSRDATGNNFRGKGYVTPGVMAPNDMGVVSHANPSKP